MLQGGYNSRRKGKPFAGRVKLHSGKRKIVSGRVKLHSGERKIVSGWVKLLSAMTFPKIA
jgi:hypothetical protein